MLNPREVWKMSALFLLFTASAMLAQGSDEISVSRARPLADRTVVTGVREIEHLPNDHPFLFDMLGASASFVIAVKIDESGAVTNAMVRNATSAASLQIQALAKAGVGDFVRWVEDDVMRWRFKAGEPVDVMITYRFLLSGESCVAGATILTVKDHVATLTACEPVPDHAPWSDAEVAYINDVGHPGPNGSSKGVGAVFLAVRVNASGRVRSVKVLSGPSDLAAISATSVRDWVFAGGRARTITLLHRYSVVKGRCVGNYAGVSGSGTMMNIIGCVPN